VSHEPEIVRVRHELKRRHLSVARVERLAPKMLRVVLSGAELEGFTSLGFDDHIKLFFPSSEPGGVEGANAPEMRDFTPRRYDAAAGELWVEFFLHDAGPAAAWASQARVGQSLMVGGPRGSAVISQAGIDSYLLIGDETAFPAIARRLDELPQGTRVLVVIECDDGSAGYPLESKPAVEVVRVSRTASHGAPAHELISVLRKAEFPPGRCFGWVAVESQSARAIRRYLVDERGFEKRWVKAAGYWQRGATGTHDTIQDSD
jgi:NADPH-dependent ferric siderophore reductase